MIYLDSCLIMYLVEDPERCGARLLEIMSMSEALSFAISPLVRLECLVKPFRNDDLVLQDKYRRAFDRFSNLVMTDVVYDEAAHLYAKHGLPTPDALHLACARYHGCARLWTNDRRFARAMPDYVVMLSELASA